MAIKTWSRQRKNKTDFFEVLRGCRTRVLTVLLFCFLVSNSAFAARLVGKSRGAITETGSIYYMGFIWLTTDTWLDL